MTDDDEELGAITAPMKGVLTKPRKPPQRTLLARHPAAVGLTGSCDLCCCNAHGYRHPNPLRLGVILWRCGRHCFPGCVRDDPKGVPGGGRYR